MARRLTPTNNKGLINTTGVAGANTFDALTDTPSTKTADQYVKVNSAGDALIYADVPTPMTGDCCCPPVESLWYRYRRKHINFANSNTTESTDAYWTNAFTAEVTVIGIYASMNNVTLNRIYPPPNYFNTSITGFNNLGNDQITYNNVSPNLGTTPTAAISALGGVQQKVFIDASLTIIPRVPESEEGWVELACDDVDTFTPDSTANTDLTRTNVRISGYMLVDDQDVNTEPAHRGHRIHPIGFVTGGGARYPDLRVNFDIKNTIEWRFDEPL